MSSAKKWMYQLQAISAPARPRSFGIKARNGHGFPYADEERLVFAKGTLKLMDAKAPFADWPTRDDIKNLPNIDLAALLHKS